jgi:excisionase family DNA binding protein
MEMSKRLTRAEAAKALRISVRTLDNRLKDGSITAVRDGSRIFFVDDEVARYAREGWSK